MKSKKDEKEEALLDWAYNLILRLPDKIRRPYKIRKRELKGKKEWIKKYKELTKKK